MVANPILPLNALRAGDRLSVSSPPGQAVALSVTLVVALFAIPRSAWAIDAANISRPAAYVWTKPSDESGSDAPAGKTPPAAIPPARAASSVITSKPAAAPLPTVPQRTANGKVFVPVKPKSKCTVKSGDGASLEAQLRACAGLAAP